MPLISIVLPVFNENDSYLLECLSSIKYQSFIEWECIIVLDSTTASNIELIEQFRKNDDRFVIIRNPTRLGLCKSLNLGISMAKANLIARMDSDDCMDKDRLELQYQAFCEDDSLVVLGSSCVVVDKDGMPIYNRVYPKHGILLALYFIARCGLAHPAVMFRKSEILQIGGYDSRLKYCEDLDLWLRCFKAGFKINNLRNKLLFYRVNSRRPIVHWIYMIQIRLKFVFNALIGGLGV